MERSKRGAHGRTALTVPVVVLMVILAIAATPVAAAEAPTLRVLGHASFFLPDEVIETFEEEHAARVEVLEPLGDAGFTLNQAILTADRPLADVLFGVDNVLLSRALDHDIFAPYRSDRLDAVPDELVLDPEHRVTPIDVADVCLNIDRAAFDDATRPAPRRLADLADPSMDGLLVVEDPATSSPGLAFLLATIAAFGEDPEMGWQSFWRQLRANDVRVVAGWEQAYRGEFSGGANEGTRPIVVSYATSPVAEVIFGPDPDAAVSPTAAVEDGCFRQIEFAGVLAGSEQPELAAAFIDHLLAPETQAELPLAMFVYPARSDVEVPQAFQDHALVPSQPLSLEPDVIEQNRERWIREWTDIVLR